MKPVIILSKFVGEPKRGRVSRIARWLYRFVPQEWVFNTGYYKIHVGDEIIPGTNDKLNVSWWVIPGRKDD